MTQYVFRSVNFITYTQANCWNMIDSLNTNFGERSTPSCARIAVFPLTQSRRLHSLPLSLPSLPSLYLSISPVSLSHSLSLTSSNMSTTSKFSDQILFYPDISKQIYWPQTMRLRVKLKVLYHRVGQVNNDKGRTVQNRQWELEKQQHVWIKNQEIDWDRTSNKS